MSQNQTQELLSEDKVENSDGDIDTRLVPVAESIRYRKRAQSAEKKLEDLTEQLAQANEQTAKLTEQLNSSRTEQELMRKLTNAGAVDLETAILLAKDRLNGQDKTDLDACIEQLKKEKQYLFADSAGIATAKKTAAVKDRLQNSQTILERAAKKAATTGNRADLQEYLKLRRNYL